MKELIVATAKCCGKVEFSRYGLVEKDPSCRCSELYYVPQSMEEAIRCHAEDGKIYTYPGVEDGEECVDRIYCIGNHQKFWFKKSREESEIFKCFGMPDEEEEVNNRWELEIRIESLYE